MKVNIIFENAKELERHLIELRKIGLAGIRDGKTIVVFDIRWNKKVYTLKEVKNHAIQLATHSPSKHASKQSKKVQAQNA